MPCPPPSSAAIMLKNYVAIFLRKNKLEGHSVALCRLPSCCHNAEYMPAPDPKLWVKGITKFWNGLWLRRQETHLQTQISGTLNEFSS